MPLTKPLETYVPGIPSGSRVTAADIPATVEGADGTTVQAVLEDLVARVAALEE